MSMPSSILHSMASVQEIIDLVRLLRQNGDKVLTASSKLSLSTLLLHKLNEAFALIVDETDDLESSFQVCNSSNIDIFRDLKFLHDFVQKTLGLKVIQHPTIADASVDITKFRHLKYLELNKVCIGLVKGIRGIQDQLESVICAGKQGVLRVEQLLATCGGDAGGAFVWNSLRHLAIPHNTLEQLDSSLKLAPWLQILDLSHNLLTNANELHYLPNLKYINLGYNRLESLPCFNKSARHCLQVLVVKNNYIENINELQYLDYLVELDLSYNCLAEHAVLQPLERISTILWVSTEGNPLSYHPKHRQLAVKHLHPCLSDCKFVLDHLPLSKSEKLLVAENRFCTIRSMSTTTIDNLASLSNSLNANIMGPRNNILNPEHTTQMAQHLKRVDSDEKYLVQPRKKTNVREAIIAEGEQEREKSNYMSNTYSASYLETSQEHLETKKQIVALREKFGENNWLTSHAGTFVQDIMGLQPIHLSISPSTIMMPNDIDSNTVPHVDNRIMQPTDNASKLVEMNQYLVEEVSTISDNIEDKGSDVECIDNVVHEQDDNMQFNHNTINTLLLHEFSEEEEGDVYLVKRKKNDTEMEELFLVLTPIDIKERDTITGQVKFHWSINSVLSCVLGRGVPITVDIIFDTERKDRQNRRYFVDADDAKKIVTTISDKINTNAIVLKVFKCMKCSTHFSHNPEYIVADLSTSDMKQIKCPTCKSTLVIQTDDLSELHVEQQITKKIPGILQEPKEQVTGAGLPAKTNLQHSESFSSIGGAEGGAMSVTTSLVHFKSHPQAQLCCSATSLEESQECSTPSVSTLTKKYESDIEILSNPSQSSIEVLEENTRTSLTPSRKRSSEERKATIISSLLTISDSNLVTQGLTESSSSGSLTDSVCTAYENRTLQQTNNEKLYNRTSEKDTSFMPVGNRSSVLGLLQSMKVGKQVADLLQNMTVLMKTQEASSVSDNKIEYSYTEFNSVDHRVKLHIILNIFEHENEELVLLLRADILIHSVKDVFPGCLVLSTSKVYILRINGLEGEDPQHWLHKEISWTMDRLRSFAPLPFKQGILIELQQAGTGLEEYCSIAVSCILQDIQHTSNFLLYITDLPLPDSCEVEFSVPQHCTIIMHSLLASASNHQKDDLIRLLALFSSAVLSCQDIDQKLNSSGLIITASILVILEDNMKWLLPNSNQVPIILKEQSMENLIDVELSHRTLTLNFVDEVAKTEESWALEFTSVGAAEAVINSIQPPWEELFSIPLQISTKTV